MIDAKLKRLINQEMDGVLSEQQRAELERKLANNPEARAYQSDMQRLAGALSEVHQEAPPPHFKKTVMNRVRARSGARPQKTTLAKFTSKLIKNFDRRIGAAFAFGCAFALLLLVLINGNTGIDMSDPDSQMVGTLRSLRSLAPQTSGQTVDLDSDGGTARLQVSSNPDLSLLTITFQRDSRLEVKIEFSPQDLEVIGLQRELGAIGEIAIADTGRITISASQGSYEVILRRMTMGLASVRITTQGRETHSDKTILLNTDQ